MESDEWLFTDGHAPTEGTMVGPPGVRMMTMLKCIDNSGATLVRCIRIMKNHHRGGQAGRMGDEIVCSIRRAKPAFEGAAASGLAQRVRKGDVRRAVIVRLRAIHSRPDGRTIRFDDNACVLINEKKEPLASRVNGVVAAEKGFGRIAALASKVI